MKKSWVLVEVSESAGEKKFKPLAGTEDKSCANRALAAMKLFKDEALQYGKDDLTLIHSAIVDDIEYNSTIASVWDECSDTEENEVRKIMEMVK